MFHLVLVKKYTKHFGFFYVALRPSRKVRSKILNKVDKWKEKLFYFKISEHTTGSHDDRLLTRGI